MFVVNDDLSIYCTRGDCCEFPVKHQFKQGDVVRFKATRKKDCGTVVIQRDFVVETDTDEITISLTGEDTKIGEVISKPTDYWYEVELNPDTHPQTIRGYDVDGAKVFKLFPEGKDVDAEDIEVVGKKTLQELVDYALEQAKESGEFDFTYEDFTPEQLESLKGENGDPGVYVGAEEPTDPDVSVWVAPGGEGNCALDATDDGNGNVEVTMAFIDQTDDTGEAVDAVVEQGRSGSWDYRKWASGVAECWRTVTATVKTTDWKDSGMMSFPLLSSFGLFWTKEMVAGKDIQFTYPFTFASRPAETACMTNGTVWFPLSLISTTGGKNDRTDSYRLCTYKVPEQDIAVTISFHVIGRWK